MGQVNIVLAQYYCSFTYICSLLVFHFGKINNKWPFPPPEFRYTIPCSPTILESAQTLNILNKEDFFVTPNIKDVKKDTWISLQRLISGMCCLSPIMSNTY